MNDLALQIRTRLTKVNGQTVTSAGLDYLLSVMVIIVFTVALGFSQKSFAIEGIKSEPVDIQQVKKLKPSPEMMAAMRSLDSTERTIDDGLTFMERIQKYVVSGFVHIIPKGLDHILFILVLFLSTTQFGKLFWQVTTFTLAHSISLYLSSVGLVSVGSHIVEPIIALSIVLMAIKNVQTNTKNSSNLILIGVFGLLHGLGFASVLSEFGLPDGALLSALFAFNLGVELGQLSVLLLAGVLFYHLSNQPSYRAFIQVPFSIIIGLVGCFWFFARIF